MKQLDERGGSGVWIFLFFLTFLLLIGAISFGVWAYLGRQDYKNNADAKAAQQVKIAIAQEATIKDKEAAERDKVPYKQYEGPATYGSIKIQYPKPWSAFVTEANASSTSPVDGYFYPNIVPGVGSGTAFALRVQVVNQTYDQVMQTFSQQQQTNKYVITAYRAPKVPTVLGSRVDGAINTGQQDSMVIFPLRDKTVEISTESNEFLIDFNTIILANMTFSP